MRESCNRKIILENGEEYTGIGFGDSCERVLEIVFNTSMVGYQEILSDPSYTYQAVVMTYPLIGNWGRNIHKPEFWNWYSQPDHNSIFKFWNKH